MIFEDEMIPEDELIILKDETILKNLIIPVTVNPIVLGNEFVSHFTFEDDVIFEIVLDSEVKPTSSKLSHEINLALKSNSILPKVLQTKSSSR